MKVNRDLLFKLAFLALMIALCFAEGDEHDHDEHGDEHHQDEHEDEHEDEHGHDEDHHDSHDEEGEAQITNSIWLKASGAALLVNCATLVGVITLNPLFRKASTENASLTNTYIPSFAAGALLATAVFLIVPESVLILNDNYEEREAGWAFGGAMLSGFFLPSLLDMARKSLFSTSTRSSESKRELKTPPDDVAVAEVETVKVAKETVKAKSVDIKLCTSILVGDASHNIADGVFMAAAFRFCSNSVAFGIVFSTIYHELAQELADYMLLTGQGGLTPCKALFLNFLSGLTVFLGVILTLALDLSDAVTAIILTFAGGLYVYIAAVEAMSLVEANIKTPREHLLSTLSAFIGVLPIALVLLNHEHCGEHSHDH